MRRRIGGGLFNHPLIGRALLRRLTLAVRSFGMLACGLRMRLSFPRLLASLFVVSLAVMLGRRFMRFRGILVMLSGLGVGFLGHNLLLFGL
jgi:hypothetical protein